MVVSNPREAAERGERIYRDKYQSAFETEHLGKYVAVDIDTQEAYVADSPEDAIGEARIGNPSGVFHLVKVGSAGAFRVSYSYNANLDWLLQ